MFTNPSSASFLIIGLIFESSISNVLFKLEISTFSLLIKYLIIFPRISLLEPLNADWAYLVS